MEPLDVTRCLDMTRELDLRTRRQAAANEATHDKLHVTYGIWLRATSLVLYSKPTNDIIHWQRLEKVSKEERSPVEESEWERQSGDSYRQGGKLLWRAKDRPQIISSARAIIWIASRWKFAGLPERRDREPRGGQAREGALLEAAVLENNHMAGSWPRLPPIAIDLTPAQTRTNSTVTRRAVVTVGWQSARSDSVPNAVGGRDRD